MKKEMKYLSITRYEYDGYLTYVLYKRVTLPSGRKVWEQVSEKHREVAVWKW